ncbi:MAG: polyamine aminopropyltransferase [Betaproteobacteria bacterium]|jgi:spermidine synthase|nr:polyamine aminopropyltransferase [Pseudomonadota bacterium]NBO03699.1 polyamine aminopropyltransferase [Betaproteobacteria bacterium]NBO95297.1 polyamine aminopropyltransferase [Betaproteobacteria bacterium]NBP33770.1 polyamine aminopropyltransferase [Betaproteobacteria bacterium]NBP37949.1 polyamine aminopropyltransferase [Betaproteobacteria bacterium]
MQGLHLTADLSNCQSPVELLCDPLRLRKHCLDLVELAGLSAVGDRFHQFPDFEGQPGGVTGMVLLAESHLALHTWPEQGAVTIDVYVCNFSTDNSEKAASLLEALMALFKPQDISTQHIRRGGLEPDRNDAGHWGDEQLNRYSRYGYQLGTRLHSEQSAFQHIEVFDSPQFGRLFKLDGDYMTSERDEFFYHEAMIHPAAIAIGAPRRALILGGGDGGSAEELLKYPSIERVVIAELDEAVLRIARRYFGSIHRGALDDPRVDIQIGDGFAFVKQSKERFDLVILDLTDPDTPAQALYSEALFADIRQRLNPQGAMVLHTGAPIFKPEAVALLHEALRRQFNVVAPLGLYVPLYGSYWTMAICSEQTDPRRCSAQTVNDRLHTNRIGELSYYNPEVHTALFALPNYLKRLLQVRDESPRQSTPSSQTSRSQARAA